MTIGTQAVGKLRYRQQATLFETQNANLLSWPFLVSLQKMVDLTKTAKLFLFQ